MTPYRNAVVVGAGKIGRGFLGHLAFRSGYSVTFVDTKPELIAMLQARGAYRLHILGAPARDETVTGVQAWPPQAPEVETAGRDADVIFVSVGGPNLYQAGKILAQMVRTRTESAPPLNVIVGENWTHAAAEVGKVLFSMLGDNDANRLASRLGIAESTILRSCIEPTEAQRAADPLSIQCQDYWELPVDADALVQPLPQIEGLVPTPHFATALQRKVYTYNAINATIAYLGYHRGHAFLADAAADPVVLKHALGVMDEVNDAICHTFGYGLDDQRRYATRALEKFQNRLIVDPIERQVRDPIRKLGRHDRLVGAAMLALDAGITPAELALSIAAALQYRNTADPAAVRLEQLVTEIGPAGALGSISGIEPESTLGRLVMSRYRDVRPLAREAAAL